MTKITLYSPVFFMLFYCSLSTQTLNSVLPKNVSPTYTITSASSVDGTGTPRLELIIMQAGTAGEQPVPTFSSIGVDGDESTFSLNTTAEFARVHDRDDRANESTVTRGVSTAAMDCRTNLYAVDSKTGAYIRSNSKNVKSKIYEPAQPAVILLNKIITDVSGTYLDAGTAFSYTQYYLC